MVSRRMPVVAWIRDRVQPKRPSARICCCVSSSKTLLMPAREPAFPARVNVSAVSVNCRLWVSTEGRETRTDIIGEKRTHGRPNSNAGNKNGLFSNHRPTGLVSERRTRPLRGGTANAVRTDQHVRRNPKPFV